MKRLILDSNVWAIYAYGHSLRRLLFLRDVYGIEIFYSGQILKEVFTTCNKPSFIKKNIDPQVVISIISDIGKDVVYFPRYMLAADMKDGFLFDMYLQNKAHCLVTEEKRLLLTRSLIFKVKDIGWLKENFPH